MSTKKNKMRREVKKMHSETTRELRHEAAAIDRAAIRQAVSELPRIMVEKGYVLAATAAASRPNEAGKKEAETGGQDNATKETPKFAISHHKVHAGSNHDPRRVWLWTGVGLTSFAIFAIWAFNLHATVQDMKIMPSPEDELLRNTRTDLNAALNFTKNNDLKLERAVQPKSAQATATADAGTTDQTADAGAETKNSVQNLLQALFSTSPTAPIESEQLDGEKDTGDANYNNEKDQ